MLSEVQDGLVTCHSLLPLAEIPKNNIFVKKMAQTDQTIYHNFFRTDRCVGRLWRTHKVPVVDGDARQLVEFSSHIVLLTAQPQHHLVYQLQGDEEVLLPLTKLGLEQRLGYKGCQPKTGFRNKSIQFS